MSEDVNAPLVTIAEAALAPAILLLQLPYLERLLEDVRDGIPPDLQRHFVRRRARHMVTWPRTSLNLCLLSQLRGLQGPLESFGALTDPHYSTVRRALLAQMRYGGCCCQPHLMMSTPPRRAHFG